MSPGRKLLIRLVQNFGADSAAIRLRISPTLLDRFLNGSVEVPDQMLLRAVDLLVENGEPPPLTAPAIKRASKQ